ncbi:MAG: ribosome silencing factor [Pseudomonadales bacterium]|nr:ribosome silencing factor [Pseudomonadales bacterium]
MDSHVLSRLATSALDDIKARDVVCLEVAELTPMADYMVIATGNSSTHVKALADEVIHQVKEAGGTVRGTEGRLQAEWVLVDLGSVVVHIMLAPTRALYSLEDLWNFGATDRHEN